MRKFITLTHLASGRPTNIIVDSITCVRESVDGRTLVLFADNQGQYVAEDSKLVVDTIESIIAGKEADSSGALTS